MALPRHGSERREPLWIYTVWKCSKHNRDKECAFFFEKKKHAKEWVAAHETAKCKYKVRREWYPDCI